MADQYEIYKDKNKQYRWRYRMNNTEIIADSAEGYINKADCQKGIDNMKESKDSPVEDSTD